MLTLRSLHSDRDPRHPHSFPTRRSSDLADRLTLLDVSAPPAVGAEIEREEVAPGGNFFPFYFSPDGRRGAYVQEGQTVREIGRASCRERVWMSWVAVGV